MEVTVHRLTFHFIKLHIALLRWVTQDLPPLGPRDLLIETRSGAISLGTELPHYLGTSRNAER